MHKIARAVTVLISIFMALGYDRDIKLIPHLGQPLERK
jgi:hypothetical protein